MDQVYNLLFSGNALLIFAVCGVYKLVISRFLSLLYFVYRHVLRPRRNFSQRYGSGTWAMITGATSGIGEGFADVLAKEGFNIILVGRSPDKLLKSKTDLENKYREVKIETRKMDLSSTEYKDFIDLGESVSNLDVSLLVNNAGCADLCPFQDQEYSEIEKMVKTNIGPYVYLTRNILPRMLKRQKKSGIVFTSSVTACFPFPVLSTYAASKAFNDHFGKSLAYEVTDKVDVLSFKPLGVSSNMYKNAPSFKVLTPIEAANGALNSLGYEIETTGHWRHQVTFFKETFPMRILPASWTLSYLNKAHRKHVLRMKEQKKKEE